MGSAYRVSSLDVTEYFNTSRESQRFKPFDEEPEEFVRLDAAGECNRLNRLADETERRLEHVRRLLEELMEVCGTLESQSDAYRNALAHFQKFPLPHSTGADRRAGGSYGTG